MNNVISYIELYFHNITKNIRSAKNQCQLKVNNKSFDIMIYLNLMSPSNWSHQYIFCSKSKSGCNKFPFSFFGEKYDKIGIGPQVPTELAYNWVH